MAPSLLCIYRRCRAVLLVSSAAVLVSRIRGRAAAVVIVCRGRRPVGLFPARILAHVSTGGRVLAQVPAETSVVVFFPAGFRPGPRRIRGRSTFASSTGGPPFDPGSLESRPIVPRGGRCGPSIRGADFGNYRAARRATRSRRPPDIGPEADVGCG